MLPDDSIVVTGVGGAATLPSSKEIRRFFVGANRWSWVLVAQRGSDYFDMTASRGARSILAVVRATQSARWAPVRAPFSVRTSATSTRRAAPRKRAGRPDPTDPPRRTAHRDEGSFEARFKFTRHIRYRKRLGARETLTCSSLRAVRFHTIPTPEALPRLRRRDVRRGRMPRCR